MALFGAIAEALRAGKSRRNLEVYVDTGALSSGAVAFTTPFKTILAVTATILNASAPGDATEAVTYSVSGNVVTIRGWRNTSGTDPTLVATTGTETVSVVVFGTR